MRELKASRRKKRLERQGGRTRGGLCKEAMLRRGLYNYRVAAVAIVTLVSPIVKFYNETKLRRK